MLNTKHYEYIKKQIGNIDILYTQFSYANWIGNDTDYFNEGASKINDIQTQVAKLGPRFTIPFASYVYFCNRENFWMNQFCNTPSTLQKANIPSLHPTKIGEQIDLTNPVFNDNEAITFWNTQYNNTEVLVNPPTISIQLIVESVNAMTHQLLKKFPFLALTMKDFSIYIDDLQTGVTISFKQHKTTLTEDKTLCRYTMCSQAIKYFFDYSWGANTIMISGMFKDNQIGTKHHSVFFWLNLMNTEFINFSSVKNSLATLKFVYTKRFEILYKYL